MFVVIVILLNLLIAQMSDTYAKVQEDVEGNFAIARARIIARLQKGKWLLCKEVRNQCYIIQYVHVRMWALYANMHDLSLALLYADIQEALLPEVRLDRLVMLVV